MDQALTGSIPVSRTRVIAAQRRYLALLHKRRDHNGTDGVPTAGSQAILNPGDRAAAVVFLNRFLEQATPRWSESQ